MTFVSYSQNHEDVLLHRVFGGQETGFYVDVGAYDPVVGSVTKAFYDRGWSGINLEPGAVFEKLAAGRPRDVNLRLAVLDRTGEVQFFQNAADAGTSHVVDQHAGSDVKAVTVLCDTLENIVREHSGHRPVDFIKIDAEGAEAAIIRSTDWRTLRPRVLLIEATLPWSSTLSNHDWEPILIEQGYRRVYFDGINCFYVPEEEAALARLFVTPVNVLDRCKQYDPATDAVMHERDELHGRLAAITAERGALDARLAVVTAECGALNARLTAEAAEHEAKLAAEAARHEAKLAAEAARYEAKLAAEAAGHEANFAAEAARHELKLAAVRDEWDLRVGTIGAERDKLLAQVETLVAERESKRVVLESVQAAHANAVEAIADQRRQIDRLNDELALANAECDSLAARLDPPRAEEAVVAPIPVAAPRRSVPKRILRRTALIAYRLVRPVVRPAAWRLRSFMLGPVADHVRGLSEAQGRLAAELHAARERDHNSLRHELRRLHDEIGKPRLQPIDIVQAASVLQIEPAGLAEMRALAEKLEHALLTIAVNSTPEPRSTPVPPPQYAPLRLPGERRIEIEIVPGDISLAGGLKASDGVWEPHVQRFLAELVKPDWVCLDIGANIGVHTLCLAALAHQGKVHAFEADPTNFAVLSRNADTVPSPAGDIELRHLAVWDRTGTLVVGGADELSGCSFVSEDAVDEVEVETQLRSVVSAEALSGTDLHVRRAEVEAITLDDWSASLMRLDFIKLDVEGAEANVVRGGDRTLWRHRPVLLVEYNPACAAAYFNQPADVLFHELKGHFASLHALQEDGSLTLLPDWDTLKARLDSGKGWEDVVCLPSSD